MLSQALRHAPVAITTRHAFFSQIEMVSFGSDSITYRKPLERIYHPVEIQAG